MRLSCPARTTCSEPRLSRCSTSPETSQVTVWSPMWGWGPMSTPAFLADRDRTHVVGEAPGPDGAPRPLRQDPADGQLTDRGAAAGLEQDLALGGSGQLGCRVHVVGADRSAHVTFLYRM